VGREFGLDLVASTQTAGSIPMMKARDHGPTRPCRGGQNSEEMITEFKGSRWCDLHELAKQLRFYTSIGFMLGRAF
jgi:hypothetical protein